MNGVERSNDGVVLKKCPFCGGEASLHSRCNYMETGNETMYFVKCDECKTESTWCYKKEKAINAWNNRKPLERVIERLEERMEKCFSISEKSAELGTGYERHTLVQGAMGIAFEEAIEIIKESL